MVTTIVAWPPFVLHVNFSFVYPLCLYGLDMITEDAVKNLGVYISTTLAGTFVVLSPRGQLLGF